MNRVTAVITDQDVQIWTFQFYQHAQFIAELLDEKKAGNFKPEALLEVQKWTQILSNGGSLQDVVDQLNELSDLQKQLLAVVERNQDIGPIYPSFLRHMLKEQAMFVKLASGQLTVVEELKFWLEEAAEHTGLAAHLLDPSEKDLTKEALALAESLELGSKNVEVKFPTDLFAQSIKSAEEMLAGIKSAEIKSLLSPTMLEHEIRESRLGEYRLELIRQLYQPVA